MSEKLVFVGIFKGKEKMIRITDDKKNISIYDIITVANNGENEARKVWKSLPEYCKNEIKQYLSTYKFKGQGQRETPVIHSDGIIKFLMFLPGKNASIFRSLCSNILIRYLGGDLTLVNEIQKNNNIHIEKPDNLLQTFRKNDIVQKNLIRFTQGQINISNNLIKKYGNVDNTVYCIMFYFQNIPYFKIGCTPIQDFNNRLKNHKNKLGDIKGEICVIFVRKFINANKVESEFKKSEFFKNNRIILPKKNGGKMIEILKLSEEVTSETIKSNILKIAGDRLIDENNLLNSSDNVQIEKEKTKQAEIKLETLNNMIDFVKWNNKQDIANNIKENIVKNITNENFNSLENELSEIYEFINEDLNIEEIDEESEEDVPTSSTSHLKELTKNIKEETIQILNEDIENNLGNESNIEENTLDKELLKDPIYLWFDKNIIYRKDYYVTNEKIGKAYYGNNKQKQKIKDNFQEKYNNFMKLKWPTLDNTKYYKITTQEKKGMKKGTVTGWKDRMWLNDPEPKYYTVIPQPEPPTELDPEIEKFLIENIQFSRGSRLELIRLSAIYTEDNTQLGSYQLGHFGMQVEFFIKENYPDIKWKNNKVAKNMRGWRDLKIKPYKDIIKINKKTKYKKNNL